MTFCDTTDHGIAEQTPLVSLIVPVYKVEKFLDRCVQSIVGQTYTNLEIILVDDGSPDSCPKMCDSWAERDSRIIVIHKENGGLSSARNAGLDRASGELIGFVGSDDFIMPDMCNVLYRLLTENDADASMCEFVLVNENGEKLKESPVVYGEVLSHDQILKKLAPGKSPLFWHYELSWGKLYKARLFDNLRFPEGRLHEDSFIAPHLFDRCRKVAVTPEQHYLYMRRNRSTASDENGNASAVKFLDDVYCFLERYDFFTEKDMHDEADCCLIAAYGSLYRQIQNNSLAKFWREFSTAIFKVSRRLLGAKGLKMKLRIVRLFLMCFCESLKKIFKMASVKIKKLILSLTVKIRIPLLKTIVLESNPELACNTMPVYEEMLRRKVNDKYKIVWRVENSAKYKDYNVKNVSFISYVPKTRGERILWGWYQWTSKAFVFSNRIMRRYWKNQLLIYLGHGMPVKAAGEYGRGHNNNYVISSCEKLNLILSVEWGTSIEKFVTLGYPRTDVLGSRNDSPSRMHVEKFSKLIIWMPTFRQHRNKKGDKGINGRMLSFGLPLIDTVEQIESLNAVLSEYNILLIIKIHPAQKLDRIKPFERANIVFMSDAFITEHGTTLYKLLAETDALLTDYSSVYYDYLLTDKPIGLIIDDIKEYDARRGFAIPSYKDYLRGVYINNCKELEDFIRDIGNGIDSAQEERHKSMKDFCDFTDFRSTERVTDFVLSKLSACFVKKEAN